MTYQLRVNGQTVSSELDKKLLRFLRDDLRLTSVKDGCSEGSCGVCTVLINGKAVRSCSDEYVCPLTLTVKVTRASPC